MAVSILGLGTAVPPHVMTTAEAAELGHTVCYTASQREHRLLDVIYRKSGVEKRYTVLPHRIAHQWLPSEALEGNASAKDLAPSRGPTTGERMRFYEEQAFELAKNAVVRALAESGAATRDVTHLVTVSCTGFYAPGVDIQLMRHFDLRPTCERVHVGFMGCHAAINGMRVAQALASQHAGARVLLCAVELCTLHYRFQWDAERFLANALFADGAAAVILSGEQTASPARKLVATGSCLLPDSADAMSWKIGDYGFEMSLSSQVSDLIKMHLKPWLTEWLSKHGYNLSDIASWAVHPGGPRILDAVEESLGLSTSDLQVSREILAYYGNMSSPTVLFILERFNQSRAKGPCVMLGFGPGLVAEAALLT